jgi:hypothetical protein
MAAFHEGKNRGRTLSLRAVPCLSPLLAGAKLFTQQQIRRSRSEDGTLPDPKQEETFKVVDRRLFTEDGQLRQDAVDRERREEAAEAKAATAAKAQAPPAKTAPEPALTKAADASPDGAAAAEDDIAPSRGFQMLVDFLTRNAAAMLGGMADPRTGQPYVDIEGAREMIDMLDALREKTRGNLAKVDDELLLEVIGSLKLTFMELSKAAAAAMAKQSAGKK